jgi:hypothetical protein
MYHHPKVHFPYTLLIRTSHIMVHARPEAMAMGDPFPLLGSGTGEVILLLPSLVF